MKFAPSSPLSDFDIESEARARPLGAVLARRAIVVCALGLILYTIFEVIVDPPVDLMNFFTHHFLHVIATAVFIWLACWLTLRNSILRPVDAIFRHLYHIRLGRMGKLAYRTEVTEMNTIINGINLLVERFERTPRPEPLSHALDEIQQLRNLLRAGPGRSEDSQVEIMKSLTRLESNLLDLMCLEKPRTP